MKTRIFYSTSLPSANSFPEETLLFYDSILRQKPAFRKWSKTFAFSISLEAGEGLKTLARFQQVLNKISKLDIPKTTKLTFVAVGGGSLTDFVGFLASVFLRGRELVFIPSTWLAAVDSAHGGKNGLNFQKNKNQLGTFYPPAKIYICSELLQTQPSTRLTESMGEILKIALLSDRNLFASLEKSRSPAAILKQLPKIVALKYRIVEKDPNEKKGIRRLLNLGHTMGHVFESYFGWPHGVCVLLGLQFSARWSLHRGILELNEFMRISLFIENLAIEQNLDTALKKMSSTRVKSLLSKDKKIVNLSHLDFVFINRIGKGARRAVTFEEILNEVKRQKLEY